MAAFEKKVHAEIQAYRMWYTEEGILHHPYELEARLFEYVRTADTDGIAKLFHDPAAMKFSTGTMSRSPKKQAEYTTVLAIHLFLDAAIAAGVNPYDAYDLSDAYLQRLSSNPTVERANQIFLDALGDFIALVREAGLSKEKSVHIKKCKDYIHKHLNTPFSYEELAAHVGLNRTYLSTLFHETEGVTIHDYLMRQKVSAAENLLKYSDQSITEISEFLYFQSVSYFGVIFKKHTGMTPRQFRKLNKPQSF